MLSFKGLRCDCTVIVGRFMVLLVMIEIRWEVGPMPRRLALEINLDQIRFSSDTEQLFGLRT